MAQSKATTYNLSINKIALMVFFVLLVGIGAGFAGQKLQGMKSDASMPCASENNDVSIYSARLASILRKGGTLSQMQMNNMLDLIEIRDDCEHDWLLNNQMLALK